MLLIYLIIAVSLISAFHPSHSLQCRDNQFSTNGNITNTKRCCDLCQKGFFMEEPCTSMSNTKCAPCRTGHYNDKWNNATNCKKCQLPCTSGKTTTVQCTDTTNRQCHCPAEKYWDAGFFYCTPCHKCEEGRERQIRDCTEKHDRQCEACPLGTYAQRDKCLPCKRCKVGEVVVKNCGESGNTECKQLQPQEPKNNKPRNPNNNTVQTTRTIRAEIVPATSTKVHQGTPVTNTPALDRHPTQDTPSSLLIAIVACSVPVLLLLVVLLIYCHRKQVLLESNTKQPQQSDGNDTSTEDLDKNTSPRNVYVTQSSLQKKPEVKIADKGMLWRDIPGLYSDELGAILNPQSTTDWSVLAGKLGFSQQQISNFRLEPVRATQTMLEDWGTSSSSTVYDLYQTLKNMRRDDAAEKLLPLFKDPIFSMV